MGPNERNTEVMVLKINRVNRVGVTVDTVNFSL